METKKWKDNLLLYINKLEILSEDNLIKIINKDTTLLNFISLFFDTENLQDIVVLYGENIKIFKDLLKNRNIICLPILEGKSLDKVNWEKLNLSLSSKKIQLSYLILNDIIDPLYELRLICDKYNFDYNINNLSIKCLIDNRTNEYKKQSNLSIESRSGLIVNSVIAF